MTEFSLQPLLPTQVRPGILGDQFPSWSYRGAHQESPLEQSKDTHYSGNSQEAVGQDPETKTRSIIPQPRISDRTSHSWCLSLLPQRQAQAALCCHWWVCHFPSSIVVKYLILYLTICLDSCQNTSKYHDTWVLPVFKAAVLIIFSLWLHVSQLYFYIKKNGSLNIEIWGLLVRACFFCPPPPPCTSSLNNKLTSSFFTSVFRQLHDIFLLWKELWSLRNWRI